MSYCAYGNGSIALKENANEFELFEKINTVVKDSYCLKEFKFEKASDNNIIIRDYGYYDEDEVMTLLNVLSPYIMTGYVCYSGEEHSYWKYVFNPKTKEWVELAGGYYFSNDDLMKELSDDVLVKELTERGYKIVGSKEA